MLASYTWKDTCPGVVTQMPIPCSKQLCSILALKSMPRLLETLSKTDALRRSEYIGQSELRNLIPKNATVPTDLNHLVGRGRGAIADYAGKYDSVVVRTGSNQHRNRARLNTDPTADMPVVTSTM